MSPQGIPVEECPRCADLRRICERKNIRMETKPICSKCYANNLHVWLNEGTRPLKQENK